MGVSDAAEWREWIMELIGLWMMDSGAVKQAEAHGCGQQRGHLDEGHGGHMCMPDLPEPAVKMQLALGKALLPPTQPRPGDPDYQGLLDLAGRRR